MKTPAKSLFLIWIIFVVVLFPISPIQFADPRLEFFRAWLYEWLPVMLLVLITRSNLITDQTIKVPVLVVLVPLTIGSLLIASFYGTEGIAEAVDKNENIFSKPKQIIRTASSTITSSQTCYLVDCYLEIRQEWTIIPGIKFVRYIDRLVDPPWLDMQILADKQIRYQFGFLTRDAKIW